MTYGAKLGKRNTDTTNDYGAKPITEAQRAKQFFADASASTKGIIDLFNQKDSPDRFKNLSDKRNELNKLLSRAENVRNQFAGNKNMIKSVDNASNFLKNINNEIDKRMPKFQEPEITPDLKVNARNNVINWETQRQRRLGNQMLSFYEPNKDLSFEELANKRIQNSMSMDDNNRESLNNEKQWISQLMNEKGKDEDYKNITQYAQNKIKELKNRQSGVDNASINYDARAAVNKAGGKKKEANSNINKEIELWQQLVDDYADYNKYGKSTIDAWQKEIEGMSYADRKKYIEGISTNAPQKTLEKEIKTYASGGEYLNSLPEGEKPTAQGFFAYMEDNNRSVNHEMREKGKNDVTEERNRLLNLDRESLAWENDENHQRADKTEYLTKYSRDNLNSYEDYQLMKDEYDNKISESTNPGEVSDLSQEFQKKYGDRYLELNQKHIFTSLPQDAQESLLKLERSIDSKTDSEKKDYLGITIDGSKGRELAGLDVNKEYANKIQEEKAKIISKYNLPEKDVDNALTYSERIVNQERAEKERAQWEKFGDEHPILGSIASVPMSLTQGAGAVTTFWDKLQRAIGNSESPIDYNSTSMRIAQNTNALRSGASPESDLGKFVYDTFMSTVDSAATLPLNMVVPGATTIILGSSAAASTLLDAHEKGASDSQALLTSIGAGIFEGFFEKFSLDKLVEMKDGVKNIKSFLSNTVKSMGIEGSEEGFTEISNIVMDSLVNGELSDYNLSVENYKQQGYSKSEAESQARSELAVRVAQSVGGGMLGGALFSAPIGAANYAQNKSYRDMSKKGQNIIDNGIYEEMEEHIKNNYSPDSELYQQMLNIDKQDSAQVGFLANTVEVEKLYQATDGYQKALEPAISERLQELNVPADEAERIAYEKVNNIRTGMNVDIELGKYEDAFRQVEKEIEGDAKGKETAISDKIDRTEQKLYANEYEQVKKWGRGESLRPQTDETAVDKVNKNIEAKQEQGKIVTEGKSYLISDDNTRFDVTSIVVGTDGKTKVNTNTNQTYDIEDVAVDREMAVIDEFGKNYTPEQRKNFFRSYNEQRGNVSAVKFASSYEQAYQYGLHNLGVASAMRNTGLTSVLTTDSLGRAYSAGKMQFEKNLKEQTRGITKGAEKGKVRFDNVARENLNETQKAAVGVAEILTNATGVNYEFFESEKDEKGNYVSENGSYNRNTNTIRIDINAGMKNSTEGSNIMIVTLAHELTHYIEEFSPTQYTKLQEFALSRLSEESGQDINELIHLEKDRIRERRNNLNQKQISEEKLTEEAKSELVARSFEGMLTDAKAVKQLAQQDVGLFNKLKNKVMEFVFKIEKACRELLDKDGKYKDGTVSKEARALQKYAKEMREIWVNALKDAGENKISEFRNAETTSIKLQDRNEYPYNAKTVIQDYLDNIDEKIKRDYESVVAGDKKFKRNYINDVDSRQARDFKKLTGVDVEGYTNNINTNAYQHIYERHGNNGKHDTTMSKSEDVARMKYVIENYDKAELVANEDTGEIDYSTEFRDKNDNPAKLVKLSKQINGAHYVIITAADNKYKKLWVVSTYIKKRVTQALDVQAPRSNVQNALASPLNNSISQKSENDNNDIRFSMRQSVEETKNLIAVHNLSDNKLLEMIKLGGFPMPSIAITKANKGHEGFGNISVVFKKETIDPVNKDNKVYAGDAWTAVFPETEYKLSDKGLKELADIFNTSESYIEQFVENPKTAVEKLKKEHTVQEAFIKKNNVEIERKTMMPPYRTTLMNDENIRRIIKERNIEIDDILENKELQMELCEIRYPIEENEPRMRQLNRRMFLSELEKGNVRLKLEDDFEVMNGKAKPIFDNQSYEKDVKEYLENHDKEYTDYVERSLDNVYEGKYLIRPKVERFNHDGSSKSFEQLHLPYNLKNIVRIMKQQDKGKGGGWFGGARNLKGAATQELSSLEDIKSNQEKIQTMSEEEWSALFEGLDDKISEIDNEIVNDEDLDMFTRMSINDGVNEIMTEAFSLSDFNKAAVKRKFAQEQVEISDRAYEMMKSLRKELQSIPVQYFEAKPERAVGLEEIAYIVIPNNTSEKIKNVLDENNVRYKEYQAENKEDRTKALNSEPNVLFQERNTEPSNREILATALKTTAVNDIEREKITQYQECIEELNDLDKKYDVVDGALKDLWLSFYATGKKETATIEDLTKQKESIRRKMNRYDKQLLNLESTTALKNLLDREKAAVVKKQRQVDSEKLKAYRKAQGERFDRQQKRYQDMAKSRVESRRRIEARNKVIKRIDKLNTYLEKPDNKKYIPAGFMQSTVSLLKNLNQDVMNVAQRADEMRERMAGYENVPEKMAEQYEKLMSKKNDLEKRTQRLSNLYAKIENDPLFGGNYSEVVQEQINKMLEVVEDDKPIGAMNVQELNVIKDTIDLLNNEITKWRETLDTKFIDGNGNERNIAEVSKEVHREIMQRPARKDNIFKNYTPQQLTSVRMFKLIGGYTKNGVCQQIGEMLNQGQLDKLKYEQGADAIFNVLLEGRDNREELNKMRSYKKENLVDIGLTDEDGNTVKITRGMMIAIALHLENEQNRRHAMYGGFTVPELSKYYNNQQAKSYAQNKRRVFGVSPELAEMYKEIREAVDNGASNTQIIELERGHEEIIKRGELQMAEMKSKIESLLSEYDRKWIKCTREYFDNYSKNAINEVTMKRYGMKKAGVDNYFPIHTDSNYLSSDAVGKGNMPLNLENAGFMKDRVKSAKPIYLEDIVDVINNAITSTGTYVGFLIPQYNYNKIMGYTANGYKDNISTALDKKFGRTAKDYLGRLEKDLFGGRSREGKSLMMAAVRGNLARASLSLNLAVAAGQAASYPTAAPVVGAKSLAKALVKGGKNGWVLSAADRELINKYTPLLWYRNKGNISQDISDMKNGDNPYDPLGKAFNKFDNASRGYVLNWIQKIDVATVGRLWYASEYYVDDNFKNLKKGTDAYYEEVAKVFNRVVEETQPNYTTMQRPHVLRSQNEMVKALTMFSTQRMQNFNILYDSYQTWQTYKKDEKAGKNGVTKEDVKQAKKTFISAVTSQIVAEAVLTAMKVVANALLLNWRGMGDDDDEISVNGVAERAFDQFLSNSFGTVMGGAEVYEAISAIATTLSGGTYYGLSLNGFDSVTDIVEKSVSIIQKTIKGEVTEKDKTEYVKSAGTLLGIPITQGWKLLDGVIGWGGYAYNKISGGDNELADYANTDEIKTERLVAKSFSDGTLDKELFSEIERMETEKAKEKYPGYSDKLIKDEVMTSVRSKYTKVLKENYQSGEVSKEETIKRMKSTGLYRDSKSKDNSKDTLTGWEIAELEKQYKAVSKGQENFNARTEIRKKLYATKHWKSLKELDKQLKKWRD